MTTGASATCAGCARTIASTISEDSFYLTKSRLVRIIYKAILQITGTLTRVQCHKSMRETQPNNNTSELRARAPSNKPCILLRSTGLSEYNLSILADKHCTPRYYT